MNSADALARDAQLRAGLENPTRDSRAGVWRERVTGHKPTMGGTRIPSASDGTGGGQLGIDPAAPLPYTVSIGEAGRGGFDVEIDPGVFVAGETEEIRLRCLKEGKSVDDVYVEMARITKERKAGKRMTTSKVSWPQAFAAKAGGSKDFGGSALAVTPVPRPAPAPAPVQSDVVASLGGPAGMPAVEQDPNVSLVDQRLAELEALREILLEQKRAELDAAAAAALAPPAPVGEQIAKRDPDIEVTFQYPKGGRITGRYHHAAFESNETLLVLTFDQAASGVPVVIPEAAGTAEHVVVSLIAASGGTGSAKVLSMGLAFPVADRYVVLAFPVVARLS